MDDMAAVAELQRLPEQMHVLLDPKPEILADVHPLLPPYEQERVTTEATPDNEPEYLVQDVPVQVDPAAALADEVLKGSPHHELDAEEHA